jgi:hypothetical protein
VGAGAARWGAVVVAAGVVLAAAPARAFDLTGHEVIEATAYKRLLAMDEVPGTGVSGRVLLWTLIDARVLLPPPCFDLLHSRGDCDADARLALPLRFWPLLGSGAPDLVVDRQLGQQGQCQHFMAQTADALSPVDPATGVPGALATTAYVRCVTLFGQALDGMLRDPALAHWRLVGTYALMHGIEDSFSAAHVDRDERLRVRYLLSWTLIDWPWYFARGQRRFPAATHHGVTDERDAEYLRHDARAPDGRACAEFLHPYAVPEACLSVRALAAASAVTDLLVMLYRLEVGAAARGQRPSLVASTTGEEPAAWRAYVHRHLDGAYVQAPLPVEPRAPPPRPDVFLGLQGIAGPKAWGVGPWGARLVFLRATVPFALGLVSGASFRRDARGDSFGGAVGISLLLPLVRRFTIGASPASLRFSCDTRFHSCAPEVQATLGLALVPLGGGAWVGATGPEWSWTERAMGGAWFGIVFGLSHEVGPPPRLPPPVVRDTWNPPRHDEVHGYRLTHATRILYLATTAWASEPDAFVGGGIEWRLDRDRWNRRSGFAPGVQVEVDQGSLGGGSRGGGVAVAPTARVYVIHDRVALTATPLLVRGGVLTTGSLGVDVAARGGLAFELGNVELAVDSFPLSYLPDGRRELFPLTVRLGVLVD